MNSQNSSGSSFDDNGSDNALPSSGSPCVWLFAVCSSEKLTLSLIGIAWRVLAFYHSDGRDAFTPEDAIDVFHDFVCHGDAKIVLCPSGRLAAPLPSRRYQFILARLPAGKIRLRVIDLKGRRLYDAELPRTPETVELAFFLQDLWHRKNFHNHERTVILDLVRRITKIAAPGRFYTVIAGQGPSLTPEERFKHLAGALRNHARDWARWNLPHRGRSLDEPIVYQDGLVWLRDLIADESIPAPGTRLFEIEAGGPFERTLDDLPSKQRSIIDDYCFGLASGWMPPHLQTVNGRRQLCDAKADFTTVYSAHERAATVAGRALIQLLADFLVREEADRRLIADHFTRGIALSRLWPDPHDADAPRQCMLPLLRSLQPALDRRRERANHLLPQAQRARAGTLFNSDAGGTDPAALFTCSKTPLSDQIRLILSDLSMLIDAFRKASSPAGQTCLKRRMALLPARQKEIVTALILEGRSLSSVSTELEMSEEEVRGELYQGLCRIYGRRHPD